MRFLWEGHALPSKNRMLLFDTKYNTCNARSNPLYYFKGRIEITALKVEKCRKFGYARLMYVYIVQHNIHAHIEVLKIFLDVNNLAVFIMKSHIVFKFFVSEEVLIF